MQSDVEVSGVSLTREPPGALVLTATFAAVVVLTYVCFFVGIFVVQHELSAVLTALMVTATAAVLRDHLHTRYVLTLLIAGVLTALASGILFESFELDF